MGDFMQNSTVSVLETQKLAVGYSHEVIVDGVSLNVCPGEILCLIGPNGAGKTTILKTLAGQLEALGGKISVIGKDFFKLSERDLSVHVSLVMTEKIHPEYMTCREVVETGRYPYTGRFGLLCEEDNRICDEALLAVDALDIAEKSFGKVSDGQRQRIMFARAIAQQTEILILDEPSSFLDMRHKIDLMRIIKRLAGEQKKAVIVSMHELELVRFIADKLACISEGKIVRQGTCEEIFSGNFIQRLYKIRDEDFDPMTGTIRLDFHSDESGQKAVEAQYDGQGKTGVNIRLNLKNAKVLMIQGTMSNAGKSLITAGLCRIFKQDGWKVAPFKSQNMALNSFVTEDGLEMGRAQVMQAEAAGAKPDVLMNPVLLKPTSERKSQVIVKGEVLCDMDAKEYFSYKTKLVPVIQNALEKLAEANDIIVIEGAGSPAEINLKKNDIVNMGLAKLVNAPVILVGDIDRGGVFAQLLGTLELLEADEKSMVKGLIINKFRGDEALLDSGVYEIEKRSGKKVLGVIPYMKLFLDDEDSLSSRFVKKPVAENGINIGIIKLPHISNFSDFSVFEQFEGGVEDVADADRNCGFCLHYLDEADRDKLVKMDMIILPGSKNTIYDLNWLNVSGLATDILHFYENQGVVFGICGGFQMLGQKVLDPDGVEGGSEARGLGIFKADTVLEKQKIRKQVCKTPKNLMGFFDFLNEKTVTGYEIHMGKTSVVSDTVDIGSRNAGASADEVGLFQDFAFGTYIHGFFDSGDIAYSTIKALAKRRGVNWTKKQEDYVSFKEKQYNILADTLRKHIDMKKVYELMGI